MMHGGGGMMHGGGGMMHGGGMIGDGGGMMGLRQCVQPLQLGGALSAILSSRGQTNLGPSIMAFILQETIAVFIC